MRRGVQLGPLLLAVVLVGAACGGGDDNDPQTSRSASSTTSGPPACVDEATLRAAVGVDALTRATAPEGDCKYVAAGDVNVYYAYNEALNVKPPEGERDGMTITSRPDLGAGVIVQDAGAACVVVGDHLSVSVGDIAMASGQTASSRSCGMAEAVWALDLCAPTSGIRC